MKLTRRQKEHLFKKTGGVKVSIIQTVYKLNAFFQATKKLHLKEIVGDSRHKRVSDSWYLKAIELFDVFKIGYVKGNDAPRGGQLGDFLEVKSKKKLRELLIFIQKEYDTMGEK